MRERRRTVMAVLSQGESAPAAVAEGPSPDAEISTETSTMTEAPAVAAKPKRSPKRKTTEPEPPAPDRPLLRMRRVLYRPKVLLGVAALLVATAVVPQFVKSLPDPAERQEYRFETAKIEIAPPPRDVPPDIVDQVLKRARVPETVSLLDDDLTEKLAKAFASHPWVAEVVSVRKSFPPRVQVQLKYRRPVAMVATAGGMYPIDAAAVLLPPEDFSMADTKRYPLLRGVQTKPQGPAGVRWGDVVVEQGAKLAVVLQPHWKALQLDAIVVPESESGGRKAEGGGGTDERRADTTHHSPLTTHSSPDSLKFVLTTTGGSRILWGRAPGSSYPGELSAEKKIARLKKYLTDFGGFDQPQGPYEIDIRHWQEITRRPLSAASSPRSPARR
jgi:hypothetical protein